MRTILTLLMLCQTPNILPPAEPPPPPATSEAKNVLRGLRIYLITQDGLTFKGHACPTAPFLAFGAAHVFDEEGTYYAAPDSGHLMEPSRLIQLVLGKSNPEKDIIELSPRHEEEVRGFPYWFKKGDIPKPGEPAIGLLVMPNNVSAPSFGRVFGQDGDFVISNVPVAMGSSGSCSLDSEGRAWGLAKGRITWGAPDAEPWTMHEATLHTPLP